MYWAINSVISILASIILEVIAALMEQFTDVLANTLGSSPELFQKMFPITANFTTAFQAIGCGLIIAFFILGCVRNMFSGLGTLGEKPFHMVVRTIFAFMFVFLLPQGMSLIYTGGGEDGIFATMYKGLAEIEVPNGNLWGLGTNVDGVAAELSLGFSVLIGTIIILILLIMICMNFFKLLLEMFERYLMVNVLVFFSPLVGSAFTLESTMKVFQTYLKMFFGQMMLLLMNLVSLKVITSGLHQASTALAGTSSMDGVSPIVALLLVIAMLKIAQKIDNYMRDIGMVVGISGGNLTDEIIGTAHTLKNVIGSPFGKKGSGGAGGAGGSGGRGLIGGFIASSPYFNAAKDAFNAQKLMNTAGSGVTNFKDAMRISHAQRVGSTNATETMNSSVPYRVGSHKSSAAYKRFAPNLSAVNNPTSNGIDFNNLRGVRFSQGGMVGIDRESGDVIAGSYTKPHNMDYVSTYQDANGNDFYVKNETKANELYQAANHGQNSPEYDAVCNVQNTNGNFSSVQWNKPPESSESGGSVPQATPVSSPVPSSSPSPAPISESASTYVEQNSGASYTPSENASVPTVEKTSAPTSSGVQIKTPTNKTKEKPHNV